MVFAPSPIICTHFQLKMLILSHSFLLHKRRRNHPGKGVAGVGSDKGRIKKRKYLLSTYCTYITLILTNFRVRYSYCRIFLRYNPYNIQISILKCRIQWHLVYSNAGQPLPLSSFKTFSSPQKNTLCLLSNHSTFLLVITNLHSVSMDWLILDIPYQRNHIIYQLLIMAAASFI